MIAAPPPVTEPPAHEWTTTLAAVVGADDVEGRSAGRLWAESFLFTLIGVAVSRVLGFEQAGVASIFLAAGGLSSRAKQILRRSEGSAQIRSASDLLVVFFGVTSAYVGTALWLGPATTETAFAFALEAADVGSDHLFNRHFPGVLPLLGHNFAVLGAVVILSIIYRSYGALLALAWNAAVWGIVLTTLVERASPSGMDVGAIALATLPHLSLEAAAYVTGALAGARIGRDITRAEAATGQARLLGIAALILVLASAVEATVPGRVLDAARSTAEASDHG